MRILFIQYHFLPNFNVSVGQFLRYCQNLPEFGVEPVVLTRDWESASNQSTAVLENIPTILRAKPVSYSSPLYEVHEKLKTRKDFGSVLARKSLSLFSPLFGMYPDEFIDWVNPAVELALKEHYKGPSFDLILASCPPETNLLVASKLARQTGLPFVAFFGDLYGYYIGNGDFHNTMWRRSLAWLQRKYWLSKACYAFCVSPYMVEYIKQYYGVPGELVVVGFDSDLPRHQNEKNDKFIISHIGSIYKDSQRPQMLFEALKSLLEKDPHLNQHLEVRFIGSRCDSWLIEQAKKNKCDHIVKVESTVPHNEALSIQSQSDLLVAFNVVQPTTRGTLSYPSKIFEYFYSQRRVLVIPSDEDWVDELLERTKTGVSKSTPWEISAYIHQCYKEWQENGKLSWSGQPEEIMSFSSREQAKKLAGRFRVILGK